MGYEEYALGETVKIQVGITDADGNASVDPDTSTLIYITDPKGSELIAGSDMEGTAGVYSYFYDIATDATEGLWEFEVKVIDGGHTTKKHDYWKVKSEY